MKPLITIVAHTDLNRFKMQTTTIPTAYTSSIEKAGGVPLILPFTKRTENIPAMAAHAHGFLFPGGIDMDPIFYNEPPVKEIGKTDKALDIFQMAVLNLAIQAKKPILAICRGAQLVNVALGGSLFQDIATQLTTPVLKHTQETISFDVDHPVEFTPGSRLHKLFGHKIMINSRHHQSIKIPGKDLIITARAPDGVIEAAQHKNLPMDLIQWHPELLMQKDNEMLPLFKAFVKRCSPR
ncbi:MAG: gamma-glutamyl-gamma-aminobutyrate hydrolase family protein [Desulfobacteraceae bacterium]|nr:gamma-glutamyl-gamma-aminobutyrate hydrolase family protein [Desulfobacteraceae bacterium]